jgi:D-arabinose 1-dehydrogenase-like Zn-dependent alcohol dehydrogenase
LANRELAVVVDAHEGIPLFAPIQSINDSYDRMLAGDVKYRFVIDMASLAEG